MTFHVDGCVCCTFNSLGPCCIAWCYPTCEFKSFFSPFAIFRPSKDTTFILFDGSDERKLTLEERALVKWHKIGKEHHTMRTFGSNKPYASRKKEFTEEERVLMFLQLDTLKASAPGEQPPYQASTWSEEGLVGK